MSQEDKAEAADFHGLLEESLYVVVWTDDGHAWWVMWDEEDGHHRPAAYASYGEASRRREEWAAQFEQASYRVVPFRPDRGEDHG